MKRIFSSATTSPRSRTLARRTSTGPTPVWIARCGPWPWRTIRSRPSGNFKSFHMATKEFSFGDQHLSQHAPGAFTCKFAQRIVDGLRLTERKNSAISRHGVSLLSGGSGRLDTRLDTPPSINRRHPDSRLTPTRA